MSISYKRIISILIICLFFNLSNAKCTNGVQTCLDECKPGIGYSICSNNKLINMPVSCKSLY